MNLFILAYIHQEIVEYMMDKHIAKILLEAVQMLCTSKHILDPEDTVNNAKIYKKCHINHPVTIWVRSSFENYLWTLDLVEALHKEWNYRYNHNKIHKSYLVAMHLRNCIPSKKSFEYTGLTKFALAMPDKFKCNDPVKSYRQYYQSNEKKKFATWKKRPTPEWYDMNNQITIDIRDYFYKS